MTAAPRTGAVPPPCVTAELRWPGMTSRYAWVAPHTGPADEPTVTGGRQVGVAFSGHRSVVYESAGGTVTGDIPPGSAILSGPAPIRWLRVHEVTEALEIYPDAGLLDGAGELRQRVGRPDGTVLAIASALRRAHTGAGGLSDVAGSTLAHRLTTHLLSRYAGVRPPVPPGLLDARTVDRVAELVEARLHGTLTLDELAAEARLSPFHFARSFARTTGLPPHRFVTTRRMDRARQLLWVTDRPVEQVARAVGYANLSHFRRTFRRFHGVPPSALRP